MLILGPVPTSSAWSGFSRSLYQVIEAAGLASTAQFRVSESFSSVSVVWEADIVTLGASANKEQDRG